jgi:predicted deacylase
MPRLALLVLLFSSMPFRALAQTPPNPPTVVDLTIGTSVQGRPITALRVGNGPRKLALIGDTHGFPEANTHELVSRLADYYRAHTEQVPNSVRLYIVPTINPDGLALGTRFNARGVDLNRNMNTNLDSCPENDWSVTVQGARGIISDTGGSFPDSELESQIVRDFLLDASAVVFYHSNAGDVFPAFCEHAPSISLAQAYAEAGNYQYDRYWANYAITGGMHDWAASLGIAAIIPELISGVDPEFDQNLAAVQAVLGRAEDLLPLPQPQIEHGLPVHPILWRYWKMYGGTATFGPPLAPPVREGAMVHQAFANAILEFHPDQADTPYLVQPSLLGQFAVPGQDAQYAIPPADALAFAETQNRIFGAFATYWQRNGLGLLGYPLTNEYVGRTADGTRRSMQTFERGVVAYYPEDQTVRLEPLGWAALVRERSSAANLRYQIR